MICDKLDECIEKQFTKAKISGCRNNISECLESADDRSNVKCEERNKKYILGNTQKNHVISYKMDGGIILQDKDVPAETKKCDFMYVIDGAERKAILIELKGVDVAHSLKQLDGTLSQFKKVFSSINHVYGRVVVTASVPNLKTSPTYVNLYKRLRDTYKGNLKISEKQMFEKDTELDKA